MKKRSLLLALCSMFALAGCGENSKPEVKDEIKKVVIDREEYSMKVESSKRINYDVRGTGTFSKEVSISSSDEAVATVAPFESEQAFTINALSVGQSLITVKSVADETKAATLTLTVTEKDPVFEVVEIKSVSASQSGIALEEGGADGEFSILVTGTGDFDQTVSISNSDPTIASISKTDAKSGDTISVTPLAKGRTSLTITCNGDKDKTCKVDILVLENESGEEVDFVRFLSLGELVYLDEQKTIQVASRGEVNWSLEGEDAELIIQYVSTSNTECTIKAIGLGEATLVAQAGEKIAKLPVRVELNPNPTYTGYSISIDGAECVQMVKSESTGAFIEQYTYDFASIEAATRIDFYGVVHGREQLMIGNIGPSNDDIGNLIQNNLKPISIGGNDWTVQQSAENATLYLEKYEDGYSFWLTDGPIILTGFWIVVDNVPTYPLTLGEPEGEYTQYNALGVELHANEHIDILNADDNNARFCPKLNDYVNPDWFEKTTDSYINVKEDGVYDFYFKMLYGQDEVYIGKPDSYSVKIGSNDPVIMTLADDGEMPFGVLHQYVSDEAINKGDSLLFYKNGIEISNISADEAINNNILGNYDDGFVVHNDYDPEIGSNSIYLKQYSDSYSLWGNGYVETPVVYTMKVGDGEPVTLQLDESSMPSEEGLLHQYSTNVALVKDAEVTFYKDGAKISNIGADAGSNNNISGYSEVGMYIHNNYTPVGDDKSVFLKEYTDGYSVFGAGYKDIELVSYMIKIGEAEPVAMSGKDDVYTYELPTLEAGSEISFYGYYDDETLSPLNAVPNGDDTTNNIQNNLKKASESATAYTLIRSVVSGTMIYLNIYDESIGFWCYGGPTIVRLVGFDGNWQQGKDMIVHRAATESVKAEYKIENVELKTTDSFKVRDNDTWAGYANVKAYDYVENDGEGNIRVKENGNYTIYWDSNVTEGENPKSIWIEKYEPKITSFSIKINDGELISLGEPKKPGTEDPWDIQYVKQLDVEEGNRIDFYVAYDDGEPELFNSIVASPDGEEIANNLKEENEDYKDWTVQLDADDATLYVEHFDGSGWKFWLTGGPAVKNGIYLEIDGKEPIKMEHLSEKWEEHDQYLANVTLAKDDSFSIFKYVEDFGISLPLSIEESGAYEKFEASEANTVFTALKDGTYKIIAKLSTSDKVIYFGQDPVYKVVSSADEWSYDTSDKLMALKGESKTEYCIDITVKAGEKIKINDGISSGDSSWHSSWKTTGGTNNAFEQNYCYIDTLTNAVFTHAGTFSIYYETATENHGIFITAKDTPVVPYKAGILDEGVIGSTDNFSFSKIDNVNGYVEYSLTGFELKNSDEFEILNDEDAITNIVIENDDTRTEFSVSEGVFSYSGATKKYNFYLKQYISDGHYEIYIGDWVDPSALKTIYFSCPTDWTSLTIYRWKDGGVSDTWPGVAMTYVRDNEYSQGIFKIIIDTTVYEKIIFTSNGNQTVDISMSDFGTNNQCWLTGATDGSGHYLVGFGTFVE